MTDYFAVLEQPCRPWLNADALKQAFHEKSRTAHPDANPHERAGGEFLLVNEAYQVLTDPKRRLQHLLTLEGAAPERGATAIPQDIGDLFAEVATLLREAEQHLLNARVSSSPLARSLAKPQLLNLQQRLTATSAKLTQLHEQAITELQQLDAHWPGAKPLEQLRSLYVRFSYLTRWIEQVAEQQLQLSTC
jgi:curved DNA-binding protein CbpA